LGLEIFTEILAHEMLPYPRHLGGAEKEAADLWRWHAVEEIEHKGVAYDSWLWATRDWGRWKRWKLKTRVMLYVTRNFLVDRTAGALELMRQDGISGVSAWWLLMTYLWIRPGMFRKIAGAWSKFLLPGFHPWNVDDRHLLDTYEATAPRTVERKRKVRTAR
jgi:predicted metal-dependent hydrolase